MALNDNEVSVKPRNGHEAGPGHVGHVPLDDRQSGDRRVGRASSGKLEITGVGYKAAVQGKKLVLSLGYSHDVDFPIPEGIDHQGAAPDRTRHHRQRQAGEVGQVASEIRAFRPPEPYKGKGVKYAGEFIFRKEGKKK